MANLEVHYVSEKTDWVTPQFLFDGLNAEFGFDMDVSATPDNTKCKRFFTKEDNALEQDWAPLVCWVNPPYNNLYAFLEKAFTEAKKGATAVCLIPARTDTRAWHHFVLRGEIRFLKGRLKFGNAKNSAPFPSAIVIFRPPRLG